MKSWHDDDLVLHLYGEHPRGGELARDLDVDPALADRFAALARDLSAFDLLEDPEPDPGFEARTWQTLRPRLEASSAHEGRREPATSPLRSGWRWAALAATLLFVAGAAFLAGRLSGPLVPTDRGPERAVEAPRYAAEPRSAATRDRVLRASLVGHLESTGLLLTDLTHAPAGDALDAEREWAATLLASNRLYRLAAERAGQRRIVALLDELEPLLAELAHHPAAGEIDLLQYRLAERDLLFKIRVVGGRLGTASFAASRGTAFDPSPNL